MYAAFFNWLPCMVRMSCKINCAGYRCLRTGGVRYRIRSRLAFGKGSFGSAS